MVEMVKFLSKTQVPRTKRWALLVSYIRNPTKPTGANLRVGFQRFAKIWGKTGWTWLDHFENTLRSLTACPCKNDDWKITGIHLGYLIFRGKLFKFQGVINPKHLDPSLAQNRIVGEIPFLVHTWIPKASEIQIDGKAPRDLSWSSKKNAQIIGIQFARIYSWWFINPANHRLDV